MKKIVVFFYLIIPFVIYAQNNSPIDSLIHEVQQLKHELHIADSINKQFLYRIHGSIEKPRYKMYQTENIYNLLKLDTRTGAVWQVQYRMKDVHAHTIGIDYGFSTGVISDISGWDGRFELYPTKNMYTFILLDTGTGNTYQVQWGTNSDHRFMERIY